MAKASKSQNKTKPRSVKPHVVSFRMTDAQYKVLKETCDNTGVFGASSPRQFARKIICDYMAGKLRYNNPKDLRMDLESYAG